MTLRDDQIERFSDALSRMISMMMEVDDTCVELTQDISKSDLNLIGFIGKRGNVIMRDIADYMDIPYSTATGIVDKLVAKDYLDRFNSSADRRTVLVGLTKQGEGVFELFESMKRKMSKKLLAGLTSDDRENLLSLLDKLMDSLSGQQALLAED